MKRKMLILLSAAVMTVFMLSTLTLSAVADEVDYETEIIRFDEDEPTDLIGDCNNDGEINAGDLISLSRTLLKQTEYSKVLDCNGDGSVNIRDLARLKKYIADNTVPLGM